MTRLKWREFAMKPADPGEYEVTRHDKTFLWIRVSDKPWGGLPVEKLATLESGIMVVVDPTPGPAEPVSGPGPAASPGPVAGIKPVIEPAAVVIPEAKPVIVAGRECKVNPAMAKFMAGQGQGPAVVDEPGAEPEPVAEPGPGYAIPPDGFDGLSEEKRKRWVEQNWGDLVAKHGELAGEAASERLAECRVRAGRRKL